MEWKGLVPDAEMLQTRYQAGLGGDQAVRSWGARAPRKLPRRSWLRPVGRCRPRRSRGERGSPNGVKGGEDVEGCDEASQQSAQMQPSLMCAGAGIG